MAGNSLEVTVSEWIKVLIVIVYTVLFWSAMAAGVLMIVVVGMALWDIAHRRHEEDQS